MAGVRSRAVARRQHGGLAAIMAIMNGIRIARMAVAVARGVQAVRSALNVARGVKAAANAIRTTSTAIRTISNAGKLARTAKSASAIGKAARGIIKGARVARGVGQRMLKLKRLPTAKKQKIIRALQKELRQEVIDQQLDNIMAPQSDGYPAPARRNIRRQRRLARRARRQARRVVRRRRTRGPPIPRMAMPARPLPFY